jgi:hypothetical protein
VAELRLAARLSFVTTSLTTLAAMPDPPRFAPTWRRLAAGTGALFLIILAFLAGRVRAGADPALRSAASARPAAAPAVTAAPPASADPYGQDPGFDPGTGGGGEAAVPDPDPPVTRAS